MNIKYAGMNGINNVMGNLKEAVKRKENTNSKNTDDTNTNKTFSVASSVIVELSGKKNPYDSIIKGLEERKEMLVNRIQKLQEDLTISDESYDIKNDQITEYKKQMDELDKEISKIQFEKQQKEIEEHKKEVQQKKEEKKQKELEKDPDKIEKEQNKQSMEFFTKVQVGKERIHQFKVTKLRMENEALRLAQESVADQEYSQGMIEQSMGNAVSSKSEKNLRMAQATGDAATKRNAIANGDYMTVATGYKADMIGKLTKGIEGLENQINQEVKEINENAKKYGKTQTELEKEKKKELNNEQNEEKMENEGIKNDDGANTIPVVPDGNKGKQTIGLEKYTAIKQQKDIIDTYK